MERCLGVSAINHPANQEYVLRHLRGYFYGRAEGLNAKVEKPKPKGRQKGRHRTPSQKS